MRIGDLVAVLSGCDPDDTLLWEVRSEALLVIRVRPGMHQSWPETEPLRWSMGDREFLGELHIRSH